LRRSDAEKQGVDPTAGLQNKYFSSIAGEIAKELSITNKHRIPRLVKIVINAGVGDAKDDAKHLDNAVQEIGMITGQKPVVTVAKKSISNFKLRKGMSIGCKVTLRGDRMYQFFDRFVNIAIPRIRDFRGISPKSFDGKGNFTLGVKEQIIFPEIDYDKIEKIRGFNVTIVTNTNRDDEALLLLGKLGMPFRK
jgi:large subunit ribosomal protein L5